MKYLALTLFACLFFGCQTTTQKTVEDSLFYVGTYTKKDSKGIYKYALSKEGTLQNLGLVAAITNPSFLAKSKDEKTLFAVTETNENGTGFISSYAIKKDTLKFLSRQESGGAAPCFIAVNEDNYLLTANYTGGNIGLLKANEKGEIAPLSFVQQHVGKGTTANQKTPHAHSAWFHPAKDEIISADLGTNELWFSTLDTTKKELVFTDQKKLKMAAGAGPRHLAFHPNTKWIYVLNELNNTVSLVKEKKDTYFVETSIATVPNDFTGTSSAADIHLSKDGKFLYTSNRGHDTIAIFKVNSENGTLTTVGYQSVLGKNPRNFSLSPDEAFLVVANQDTNNIISFKRDATTGKLTFVAEVAAPMPVCILF
ncbi:lactonase family protein [Polaribacter sp. IC073]|uniref:lactonase family protein n=1 Tax=Polaribacter sp. IC073 TaxID=2508540 RepID=UPI0011BE5259|nr:lactonase family protein [Polaribacter sp. IC073]TXD48780.1 lactonase family protein [Polaribacter sp. IC073]